MLRIRLSRFGKKKQPTYRFIVSERAKDTHGRVLEYLGHYNPHTKVIEVKKDRILYWISKGAQPSPTVHNLLVDQNVISQDKVRASKSKKKKEEKKEDEPVAKLDAEKPAEDKVEEKKEEKKDEVKPDEKSAEEPKEEAKKEKDKKADKPAEDKKEAKPEAKK